MEFFCYSKNKLPVYFDPLGSHAATHFSDTPDLKGLTQELIEQTDLRLDKEYIQHDFKRIVGKSDLVETEPEDDIVYAKRANRDGYTRFILNKGPSDASTITLILYKENDSYTLYSAWVGTIVPSFPDTLTATKDSIPFWKNHALAWGTQEIQAGTIITEWPWGENE